MSFIETPGEGAVTFAGVSADGTPYIMHRYSDGTSILFTAPTGGPVGAVNVYNLASCRQGLYGPDGALVATWNDG